MSARGLPPGRETALILACLGTAAVAGVGVWYGAKTGTLMKWLQAKPKAKEAPLPKEKLVTILKASAAEAERIANSLLVLIKRANQQQQQYAAMGRQAPPPPPPHILFEKAFQAHAADIVTSNGATEEACQAALVYWGAEQRDPEVLELEKRILTAHPMRDIDTAAIKAGLRATMDAEYAQWVKACEDVEAGAMPLGAAAAVAAGRRAPRKAKPLARGTKPFAASVRARVAQMEAAAPTYLADALTAIGGVWTKPRAAIWEHILIAMAQTEPEVGPLIDEISKEQDARIMALGVVGGMQAGEEDDGGAGGEEEDEEYGAEEGDEGEYDEEGDEEAYDGEEEGEEEEEEAAGGRGGAGGGFPMMMGGPGRGGMPAGFGGMPGMGGGGMGRGGLMPRGGPAAGGGGLGAMMSAMGGAGARGPSAAAAAMAGGADDDMGAGGAMASLMAAGMGSEDAAGMMEVVSMVREQLGIPPQVPDEQVLAIIAQMMQQQGGGGF